MMATVNLVLSIGMRMGINIQAIIISGIMDQFEVSTGINRSTHIIFSYAISFRVNPPISLWHHQTISADVFTVNSTGISGWNKNGVILGSSAFIRNWLAACGGAE